MKTIEKITVWGVRGSFPVAKTDFMEYGGNTSCISAQCGQRLVVFDAGSGLLELGNALSPAGKKRIDILFSHLHMDHCLGLFGFRPFHDPEAEIHLYGSRHDNMGFRELLEKLIRTPYWPVGLENCAARIQVHEVSPGESFRLAGDEASSAGPTIHTMAGNHPNQSLLFRLEHGGKSVIYALDCEMDRKTQASLTTFARNGSLLIWDASYTEPDLLRYRGWGHSSWEEGIALGRAAGVGSVLMTHYSSEYTDCFLHGQEALATGFDPICRFAKEGMEFSLV